MEEGDKILQITFDEEQVAQANFRAFQTKSTELAAAAYAAKPKVELPEQYTEYRSVFEKESFDSLPEHKPWDHAIELIPGSDPKVNAKVYPLSPDEQKQLDEFLDENLKSGRIRPSKSPMASSFFFVRKKDGKLRPVQDYRRLNDITVKNKYPLPLISEIMNRLRHAKVFTKFDIRWGYNNIRIKEGDEWKASFRTNRGLFEPLVMFFGLCNSPATFQSIMDGIFGNLIRDEKIIVYMDDILIFSDNLESHRETVNEVLRRLQQNKLYLKLEKSIFEAPSVDFLGVIVGNGTATMDPEKTKAIDEWPEPKNLKELRSFAQFCNFYRNFIENFATMSKPFNTLTEKNQPWQWEDTEKRAFQALKDAIRLNVVLTFPRDDAKYRLETDASGLAVGAVLHQIIDGKPRPLGFFSKTLGPAERNYQIYDREMLAIMLSLAHWRHLLKGAPEFEVWTDHKNLAYYRQAQDLTRRQARWFTELSEYNFTMHHQPGKLNKIADFLSRGPNLEKREDDNANVIMLKPEIFRQLSFRDDEAIMEEIRRRKGQREPDVIQKLRDEHKDYQEANGIVTYRGLVYVPKDRNLRERIISAHHDSILAGHPGKYKTAELIERNYWWPRLNGQVARYVAGCETCQGTKPRVGAPSAPLVPNEIPSEPWEIISLDLIGPLPESQGYNAILVLVDRLTKDTVCVPTTTELSSIGVAQIYKNQIFPHKGLFRKVISDRGPQFASQFIRDLYQLLGIERNLSTAYHPQTDGQTERVNQEVEKYLRIFVNRRQNDWADWLPLAQFTINNRVSSSTGYSPFYLNHGRHPNAGFTPQKVKVKNQSAEEFAKKMSRAIEDAKSALKKAADQMKKDYDKKRRPSKEYQVGDKVWLENTNIDSERPSKKLDDKRYGPFEIISKKGRSAYELKLPRGWKIHPVFNEHLLSPYTPPATELQTPSRPPPEIVKGQEEFEVEEIIDSKKASPRSKKIEYRVKWKGYPPSESTWEPAENVANSKKLIADFHRKNPDKPKPDPLRKVEFDIKLFPRELFVDRNGNREVLTEPTDPKLPTEAFLNRLSYRHRLARL